MTTLASALHVAAHMRRARPAADLHSDAATAWTITPHMTGKANSDASLLTSSNASCTASQPCTRRTSNFRCEQQHIPHLYGSDDQGDYNDSYRRFLTKLCAPMRFTRNFHLPYHKSKLKTRQFHVDLWENRQERQPGVDHVKTAGLGSTQESTTQLRKNRSLAA